MQKLKMHQARTRGCTDSLEESGEVHIVERGKNVESSGCGTSVRSRG